MDNPIRYGDLFDSTLKTDIQGLYDDLNKVKTSLVKMVNEAKVAAGELRDAVNNGKETKPKGLDEAVVAYQKVVNELHRVEAEMAKLKASAESMSALQDKMNTAVSSGSAVNKEAVATYNNLKKQLDSLQTVMKNMTKDELENSESGKKLVAQSRELDGQMKALKVSMSGVASATKNVNVSNQDVENALTAMGISFNSVNGKTIQLSGSLNSMSLTQKELNKIVQLGTLYSNEQSDSYNALSQKYSVMKILINNLSQSERNNVEEGKAMVAQSKEIYEQMNALQQATGKHQLQVGQYSKAFNGLNLATQQVVRELPVLAFGFDRFIMAISNNLPILGDSIKQAREMNEALEEQRKAMLASGDAAQIMEAKQMKIVPVFKQIIKSLVSWQTIMIAVLTVLPGIIKSIKDKKKALEDQNGVLKETVNLESTFYKVQSKTHQDYSEESQEIRLLYGAVKDENRAKEERIRLAEVLIKRYPELFGSMKTEAILAGEAESAYMKLNETLHKQAKARAILSVATENEKKKIDLLMEKEKFLEEGNRKERVQRLEEERKVLEAQEKALKNEKDLDRRSELGRDIRNTEARIKVLEDELAVYIKIEQKIKDIDDANDWLKTKVKAEDFATLPDKKEEGEKAKADKGYTEEYTSYFYTAWQAEIDAMEEGMNKELALKDIQYEKDMDQLREHLDEFYGHSKEYREANAKEEANILEAMKNREKQYFDEIAEIQRKANEKQPKIKVHIPKFEEIKEDIPEYKEPKKVSWFTKILGFEDEKDFRRYMKGLEKAMNLTFKYMQEWMDMRMEMAKVATESAEKEANSAKEALDIEQQARANGYAHNVGLARKEYEEKLKVQQEAMAEEQRLARIQQQIDAAQQASSLLVATANLWANISKMGIPGIVLAGIATASMFGAFAAAQVKAGELVKTKKYGEGMSEYLDYGGSHASGNDIDFGTMKDGTKRRVEKGEMVAVINKRNVSKYGVDGVADVISSLNSGTFEDKYGLAFAGLGLMNAGADLTKVEDGIDTLVKQGEKRVMEGNGYRVEYYKNRKRIIKN